MSTDGEKKLTRYTSAVTVVTAEVMNSLFGGEYGHNPAADIYDPIVFGHVHDGQHADGHASKVLLDGGAHVRGHLSHSNLGGSGGTTPAVQAKNVQCYDESVYGPNGGGNAIPEYTEDSSGNRCYYLDLSMTIGGSDTHVQFNESGSFGGSSDFVYDYSNKRVGVGTSDPTAMLHVSSDDNKAVIKIEDSIDSHYGPDIRFLKSREENVTADGDWTGTIYAQGWDGDSWESSAAIQFRIDGVASDDDVPGEIRFQTRPAGASDILMDSHTRLIIRENGYLGVNNDSPSCMLDVDGDGLFSGDLNIGGKLTVAGLIDPTGLILTEESPERVPVETGEGAIFVSNSNSYTDKDGDPLLQGRLYYKDSSGLITNLGSAGNLQDLSDVDFSNLPSDGDVLKYDNASGMWKPALDGQGIPGGSAGSIQFKTGNTFDGNAAFVIGNKGMGVGEPVPQTMLHITDPSGNPPIKIDSLTPGFGERVVWDYSTKDLYFEPYSTVEPRVTSWDPGGGDIKISPSDRGAFIIIDGEWNQTGRVVVPQSLSDQGEEWRTGDYLWIKNMTTYTQTSYGSSYETVTVDMGSHGTYSSNQHIPIQIVGEGPDTIDGESFLNPYTLNPKNAVKLCCIRDAEGKNSWFFMSHYHEGQHDSPPVAVITANDPGSGQVIHSGDTVYTGTYLTLSGLDSYDPDGDSLTYRWELFDNGASIGVSTNQTINVDTYVYPDSQITASLVVSASGADSQQETFVINIQQANRAPTARIDAPTLVLFGEQAMLSGSKSDDLDGDSIAYSWTLQGKPSDSSYSISSNTSESISFTPDKPGSYTFSLSVSDGEVTSNPAFHTVTMDAKPQITIIGQSYIEIVEGDSFSDPGATAYDYEDLDITGAIAVNAGSFNANVPGTYTIRYNVSDSRGQAADEVTRTISVAENLKPVISLIGDSSIVIAKDSTYSELGATVSDDIDSGIQAVITGSVDTSNSGTYSIFYNATDSGGKAADQVVRTIRVNEAPKINLIGDPSVVIAVDSSYVELGATATDDHDSSIDVSITGSVDTSTSGTYNVFYNAVDNDGLSADQVVRSVRVNSPPQISLNGSATQTVVFEGSYTELGATATDDHDASVSVSITGSVNTSVAGTYTVNYDAIDSDGLSATRKTRVVTVLPRVNQGPNVGAITASGVDTDEAWSLSSTITDEDGYIKSYRWEVISSPLSANFSISPSGLLSGNYGQSKLATATFNTDTGGSYTFRLTASDNDGDTDSNSKTVSIPQAVTNQEPVPNTSIWQGKLSGEPSNSVFMNAPYSDYGNSKSISINGGMSSTIIINAAGSNDSDGSVVAWNWVFKSTPNNSSYRPLIGTPNPASSVNPLLGYYPDNPKKSYFYLLPDVSGQYILQYYVEDDSGENSDVVTIQIIV